MAVSKDQGAPSLLRPLGHLPVGAKEKTLDTRCLALWLAARPSDSQAGRQAGGQATGQTLGPSKTSG